MAEPGEILADHASNRYSQFGEDGILARIFNLLGISQGWCVDCGAWDGSYLSNTAALLRHHDWRGVLIEGDPSRYADLVRSVRPLPGVVCLNRMVGFDAENGLDAVLAGTEVPPDFDLLSIDIDGNDLHVWEALAAYTPKVVVIEYNPTIPNHVAFVQPRDARVHQGNSLLSLTELAGRKGYELAAVTRTNAVFVRRELYPRLGIADNSLDALRPSREMETGVFQLYDGTLVPFGFTDLFWHEMLPIRPERIQVVPRPLRRFPGSSPRWLRALQRAWRGWDRAVGLARKHLA